MNELQLSLNENQVKITISSETNLISKYAFKAFGYKFIIY